MTLLLGTRTEERMDVNAEVLSTDVEVMDESLTGKTLAQMRVWEQFTVVITRIRRHGLEIVLLISGADPYRAAAGGRVGCVAAHAAAEVRVGAVATAAGVWFARAAGCVSDSVGSSSAATALTDAARCVPAVAVNHA